MSNTNKKPVVEKIYITRGDNTVDHNGIYCDKCFGVAIEGKIHWIDDCFARLDELETRLIGFRVYSSGNTWGVIDEDGRATLSNKMIKINKHQDDIFTPDSYHMQRSERKPCGSVWWSINEIKERYFDVLEGEA